MKQTDDNFEAFDVLAQELSKFEDLSPEEEEAIKEINKDKDDLEEEPELEEEEEIEDTEEIEEDIDDDKKDNIVDEPTDLGEYEGDITKFVVNKLEDKLGLPLGDGIEKVDDIVDKLVEMVEESSKDVFASEEVATLNEYVKNGGDLKKFYSDTLSSGVDLDLIDIDNVSDQRKVVKENLKNRGYSDKQIERMVTRYEESGVLQEEAEDAVEIIKEFRETKKKELLEDQQKQMVEIKKRNEKYFADVQKSIKEIKDIRGIPVSEKEKKELYRYIFMPEADGKTKFQKDTNGNVKHLLEAAFLSMKGDILIERAQSKGATNTAKIIKDKLSQKSNRIKKTGSSTSDLDALDMMVAQLRKN